MIYGYSRVSTHKQKTAGSSLESQKDLLISNGAEVVFEDSYTGTTIDRPELNKLMAQLQSGDTLLVSKLDRLARSVSQGSKLIDDLLDRGISVHILNLGVLDNSSSGKMLRNILLSFAEFERDLIVERTQEGKARARMRPNYQDGRPKKFKSHQRTHAMDLLDSGMSYTAVAEATGISRRTLIRYRKEYIAYGCI